MNDYIEYVKMEYSKHKTISELFEEQVRKTPDKYALVFNEKKLTYNELNEKSNILACVLRAKGISKNEVVGIISGKSFELIIGMLSILKAGGAFLVVNPAYPENRIRTMLDNSNVKILMQSKLLPNFTYGGEIVDLNCVSFENDQIHDIKTLNKPEDLAYVIYTSGSTGIPKGVMIEHRNMVNVACFLHNVIQTEGADKVLQFFNPGFSVCYQEIFVSLLFGLELHIIDEDTRDNIGTLLEYINGMHISILFLPTSYLKVISNNKKILNRLPDTIRHIITAGEQLILNDEFVNYLLKRNIKLHNNYGTSETNMVTLFTMDENYNCNKIFIPPIGKPIANTHIYILDENLNKQPEGELGELFVSGDSVGRGYINNTKLTLERFIKNPFIENRIMYKTGDIVKYMSDGNLEYHGRTDFQIKIRGFRVEAGEVEYHLLKYDGVKEAAVIARKEKTDNQILYAFITTYRKIEMEDIKRFLNQKIPEYMVPTFIIQIDKLPKLPTGKIDRKTLSESELYNDKLESFDCINKNDLSVRLRIKTIIINIITPDHFFGELIEDSRFMDYGIDSITFILLVTKVQDEFSIEFDNEYLNIAKFDEINSFITYVENKVQIKCGGNFNDIPTQL